MALGDLDGDGDLDVVVANDRRPSYLLRNRPIQSLRNLPRFFGLRYWNEDNPTPTQSYRPLRECSFAVDYALWRERPAGYRFTSILLHVAATLFFWRLAGLWLPGRAAPLLAAGLFALHPTRVEAVVYAKNKAEVLAAIFTLAAVVWWDRSQTPARGSRGRACYVGALAALVLALLSKVIAVAAPLVLAAAGLCRSEGRMTRQTWRRLASVAPFAAAAAVFLYANAQFIEKDTGLIGELGRLSAKWRPALVVETWHGYLGMSLLPVNLHADRLLATPGGHWWAWAAGLAGWCAVGLGAAAWGVRRAGGLTFGLGWFAIFLLPVLNVVLIEGRPLADQRLYLPLAGLCLAGAGLAAGSRVRRAGLLAAVVALSALTSHRTFAWQNRRGLWFGNVLAAPAKAKPRNNLALQYGRAKRFAAAQRLLAKALELNPRLGDALYNMAAICREQGRLREANIWYSKLLQLDPSRDDAWLNAGNVFWELKMYDLAARAFLSLIELKPKDAKAYNNLAGVYVDQKRLTDAERTLRQGLVLAPSDPDLHVNLGQVLDAQSHPQQAKALYAMALDLAPNHGLAHLKLGQMFYREKRYALAKEALTRAAEHVPRNWQAWLGLALVAKAQGDRPAHGAAKQRLLELNPTAARSLQWPREAPR